MVDSKVGWNDGVLVMSLLYMCIDVQYEWDGFASCRRPIHKWLLLSYGLVVMSRLVHIGGALMLNLRQSAIARLLLSMMCLVILPTPLHLVAQNGQVEALESLIAAGKVQLHCAGQHKMTTLQPRKSSLLPALSSVVNEQHKSSRICP
ncbi:unnamed protein product [Durusdinium trenchii]|uniref:Uncharacterized protein n=1 Tax=Durusdinium trenchii TaxID=1381693 RepID=A0ABP0Q244_9DINO